MENTEEKEPTTELRLLSVRSQEPTTGQYVKVMTLAASSFEVREGSIRVYGKEKGSYFIMDHKIKQYELIASVPITCIVVWVDEIPRPQPKDVKFL